MSLKRTVLGLAAIYLACTSALWAGDGVWTTTYPFGGVIPAGGLALDPSEPARIYAAPNWRGLYRSEDAAASWQDLTADEMNSSFRSFMQFLTTDATGSALWLISFNDDGNYRPFRSLDRGESWTRLDAGIAGDLTALSVDPGSSGTLYAGTAAGELYKTVDGGASWSLTGSGLPADEIRSLAVDPLGPQVVYLGTALNGIYKSTDGGANWVNVNNNVTMTTVNDVAINPNDSQIVYAADADGVTGNGIYKSTNGGASWTKLPPTLSFDWRPGHLIAIDPTDTDVLYSVNDSEVVKSVDGGTSWTPHTVTDVQVTAIILDPATPQTLYAGTSGQGIFKSTDGAFSWAEVNQGLRGRNFPHVQAHSIEVDSSDPSIVYTGGIVGGYRSTDGGHGWSSMNLPVGEAGALVTHPSDPGVVYAFSGDLWKSSDYGVSWVNWNNGAFSCFGPGDVVMHPTDSQTLYLAGADSCAASADGVYKSTDGGLNWILMNTGLTNPRIHTLEVDPNNGDVVYAGSEQPDGPPTGVFRTTDGAASWAQLGGGLPSPLFPNQIAVHPADSNLVWVVSGMQNGGVYRSTDGGANWQKLLDGNVTVVGVDPGDVNRVYVGTGWNNGIYRSLDGGTTWALVNHGLWLSPGIVSLVVNPADPEQLFLGTTAGLYELRLRGAVTMTVDNTNDSGLGSLRDAVMQANADGTPSVIRFDPSLAGASIQLLSGLPALSEDWTTIDGDLDGDCVPDVELNGELAGSNGLDVCSSYNTIRGLIINRFSGHGIFINPFDCPPADFNRVECNYIGTDFAGTGPAGNGGNGVTVKGDALDNQVGPANVIAFNVGSGVSVDDGINWAYPDFSALTPDTVQVFPLIDFTDDCGAFHSADDITPVDGSGNAYYDTFGARFTGTLALGADGDYTFELQDVDELARLLIDGSPILDVSCCGTYTATLWYSAGDHPIELDYMEFRYNASVRLVITGPGSATLTTGGQPGLQGEIFQLRKPSERNRITENSIFDNQHFGIELIGCAPNDPGDVDIGSNTVLNYPEFTGSTDHGGGWFSVEGDAPPDSTVELFAAAPDLDQGRGEGKEFLTAVPADGDGTFAATIELPTGDWAVTATATDGDGNTSEFSAFFGLRPNPITVSSIDDSGPGSLRDAIEEANSDGYPSTITCDPGLAGETIALDSGLPPLTEDGTTIDGDLDGDCVPDVELDGSSAGSTDGIVVFSSDNRIRGLAISRFESSGILIMSNGPAADRNVVECNYLGTDLSGTVALGNGLSGVSVQNVANDNVIGPGNLVSGNLGNGVQVDASDGNVVWGNRIGTDATGATGLPNPVGVRLANGASGNTVGGPGNAGNRILGTTGGVEIADGGTYGNQVLGNRIGWPEGQRPVAERAPSLGQPTPAAACGMDPVGADLPLRLGRSPWLPEPPWCASEGPDVRGPTEPAAVAVGYGVRVHGGPAGNQIGGTSPGEGNEITRNGGAGVVVEGDGTTEIAIRGNHIDANGGLGIDLGADGVSPNDPGDGDGGPNHRMNFPVLSRAVTDGVTTDIEGVIDSPSPENVTVELYANTAADPSGYGEGETLLMSIAPDPSGNFAVTVAAVAAGTRITATATDPALSTSEFSPALEVAGPTAAATALTATAESSSAIRLRWTDPDDGESGFRVERSHDGASWGPVDAVGPDAASYLDQDLGPASPNYYRVLAFSAAGDAAPSNTAFATTFPDVAARVCRHEVSPYTSYIRFTSVAYNGSQWAAAWDDQRDGNPPQIFFELLNADGTPGGTTIQVTDGDFPSQFPTLRWNGSSFGLIYLTHMRDPDGEFIPIQPRFTRLDAGGNPIRRGVLLDLSPYTFVINDNVQDTLVWDGSHWGWFISLVDTAPSDDAPSDLAYFRLTEDGDIAAGPIFLTDTPESEYDPTAAWNGSEYGVAWLREDTSQILFQRMQADGTLLDTPRVLWENQSGTYYTSTVWDGIGWAVAWMDTPDDGSEVIYLQRLDGAGNPLGGPSRVSDDFDPAFPPEDEVPVYDEAPELQVKPGGGYLIFTSSYLSTSFANEIAVLEADAGGNRVGNRRILSPEDGNHGIYQHAVTDGSDFLVGYSDDWNGNREMADLVADASGALVAGPNTVTSGHSREDAYYPRVTSFQDGFVIFWRQMVSGTSELHARIYDGSGSMTAALTPLATRDLLRSPAAVAVGDVFAVAWEEASGNALLFDLYDAGGSSLLGEIEVTNGSWRRGMDLGWSGEVFGVTWVEDNLLHFAKVAIDGTVLGPAVAVPATDGARQPRMQWVGSGWAVVWRMGSDLYYALLDSAGAVVVPATPITFTPSTPTTDYHLQWTGELLGLAWTENRGGVGGRGIYFTVLGLDGVKAFPEVSAVDYLIWSDYSPVLVWRDGLFRLVHASGHGGVREIDLLPDGTVLPEERLLSNHSGALHLDWNGVTAGLLYAHRGDMVFMTTACLDDDTPPPSPELFGIFDGLTVSLSWTGVDDPESGILSYYLYRDGVLLAELPSSTFSLDDDGFVPGGLHVYEIQSYNGAMMESEPTAESTVAVATGSAADLEVTKSDSVDPVLAGNPLTYHLTVTNYGPDEATGVVLVDELPAGVEFVFSDPDAPTCEETAGTVTCDLATLGAGNSIDVTIEVFVEPGTPGVITNVATVVANEADTVAANNSVAEQTTVESALPGATALDATAESTSEVRLRWTDPGGGELGFRIERSPDGVDWTAFDAVAADVVAYLDQGLEAESLYYYRVVAFSGIGDGAPSNVATASTFPIAAARVCRTRIGPVHESARMISVAHNGSRWGAAWQASEGGEPGQIFFQLLDQTTLAPVGSPLQITDNDMFSQFPTLRWNGTHFGLLWTEHMRVPDGSVVGSFFFALLEADGTKVRGDVRIFADDDGGYLTSSLEMPLVWVGDGWGAFNLEGLSTPIDIVYYHLDADGDVVDGPVQLSTPEAEEDVAAAWNGSEYGVVTVRRSDTTSEVWFQRLEVDGTLVGTPAAIWENAFGQAIYGVSVVWNGSGWAVAFADTRDDGSEAIFLRLLDAAGTPLGPAVRISDEFDPAYPPEDEIPVYDETPQLVLKPGGGYEIFTSSYVWGTFVYEIGRLAADAGGNKVGARTILSDGDGIHSVINHVTTDGTNYLVGYNDGRLGTQEVAVVLADGSGAALAGPTDVTSGHSPGSSWYLTGAGTPQVVPLGAGFVALWADPISGDNLLQAQIYDGSGAVAASRFPLSARDVASWPSAVAVGDTFAVAWKDESTNAVVFDRYDAAGTSLLGEVELTTGASHHGAGLAWSGEVFGVVWVDGNQLVFQRVAVDGALVDSPVVVPGTAVGPRPRIQWVGAGWALLWRNNADSNLYYALLGPEGELLVPAVQVTYTPSRPSYYRLLWTGETLGLTWSETRGATGQDIYFTVLGLAGFKAFPEVTAVSSIHGDSHPVLTWDTDRFRLVHLSGYGGLREIEILPDGTVLPDELLVSNHTGTLHAASNGATTGLLFSHRADMFFETLECVADTTPPTAPGLGGAFDGTSVALSWTPGTDAESGILTYYLYRDGMLLAELFGTTTSFDDGGFVADSSHSYELRALNGAYLESGPSTLIISTETDPGVPIFSDGFESGDMSMWSSKVP